MLHTFLIKMNKILSSLPLTPNATYSQITLCRFNYFRCNIGTSHQFQSCEIWLEFRRLSIDAQKIYRCTTRDVHCYLWLREKMHWKMSVQLVWHFIHVILLVQRMLYLSLSIDLVGHCTRYANIKVFSETNFPVYGQNPKTLYGKICIRENLHTGIFTHCDVFHLLPQKLKHY